MISIVYIIGVSLTVALLLAVSWWSGRKVKDARSFMTGGNAGSLLVGGALLGTLAGGQSTIGTAQLAFCYGWSAWWFTIGAGIGAAVLGLVYAARIRKSGCSTLLEIVGKEYGKTAETVGSLLSMIGIFISIVAQVLAAACSPHHALCALRRNKKCRGEWTGKNAAPLLLLARGRGRGAFCSRGIRGTLQRAGRGARLASGLLGQWHGGNGRSPRAIRLFVRPRCVQGYGRMPVAHTWRTGYADLCAVHLVGTDRQACPEGSAHLCGLHTAHWGGLHTGGHLYEIFLLLFNSICRPGSGASCWAHCWSM